ncbi:MAG: hypothetical protein FJZ58_06420, partial [Chlamydiae bacterium]|nr:hypothetical protein [Chlamydiota bacterium]
MKKGWIILLITLMGCIALFYYTTSKRHSKLSVRGPYFIPIEIVEFSFHIPCINIRINEKTVKVKVDLGFCGDVSLPDAILQGIEEKSFIEHSSYFGIRGKRYNSNVYELPRIDIGNMVLLRAKAKESHPEFEKDATSLEESSSINYLGRIGWMLFYNFNFFMDAEKSLLAFCDSLDTLKKQGYPVELFTETPLLLDRNAIEFDVMTKTGPVRCLLDTGSTWNMHNKSTGDKLDLTSEILTQHFVINPTNMDQMILDSENINEIPVFNIGRKDFGPLQCNSITTPLAVDIIIGMEFLQSKLVFIDFPHRKIYFYDKKDAH